MMRIAGLLLVFTSAFASKEPLRGINELAASETDWFEDTDYSCWSMQYLDSLTSLRPQPEENVQHIFSPYTATIAHSEPSTSSYPDYIAQDEGSTEVPSIPSTPSSSYQSQRKPIFTYGSWQKKVDRTLIEQVYAAVTSKWPHDIDSQTRQACDRYLSQLMVKQPKIREALLAFDNAAIKEIARKSMPENVLARAKGSVAINSSTGLIHADTKQNPSLWFHGRITPIEHRSVIANLSRYWSVSTIVASKRLQHYALTHGLITSPESLLCNDMDIFTQAADLIFDKEAYRRRELKTFDFMGTADILHQPSEHFGNDSGGPFFLDYDQLDMKTYSHWYVSHEWHKTRSLPAMRAIQSAIVKCWVPWLERKYINKRLDKMNTILQDNPDYIDRILNGDRDIIFAVARASVDSDQMMRHYNWQYQEILKNRCFPPPAFGRVYS